MTGADVIFCDCEEATGTLNINHLKILLLDENKIKKIKAVTVVHLAGQTCDMRALHELTKDFCIELVEDACHAIGSHYQYEMNKKIPVGSCQFSSVATFSFHPVKTITSGEGGAISTNSEEIAIRARKLVSHGIERKVQNFVGDSPSGQEPHNQQWYYEVQELSGNYRLSDINAALGISQLRKLDTFTKKRLQLWCRYAKLLQSSNSAINFVKPHQQNLSCWHLFIALINFEETNIDRQTLMSNLKARGIGTQVHYIPVYKHPIYEQKYGKMSLSGAEKYYQKCLTLPLHTEMDEEDVDRVVEAMNGIIYG
jgi:dTDP-4-amino-4,6-dideoxygalactose transaminase